MLNPVIIAANTNDLIVSRLLDSASKYLANFSQPDIIRVPGALELPLVLKRAAISGKFNCYVVLGAVIKGQTDHYDHVARMANDGVLRIAIEHSLALGNGILTVHNLEQALARADGPAGNLGYSAACAAYELWQIFNNLTCDKR